MQFFEAFLLPFTPNANEFSTALIVIRLKVSYIGHIANQSQLGNVLKRCELLSEVEAKGVRLTSQRRALIQTIQRADAHLDVASLLALARQKDPHIDRATVYRTIELLKRLGLIDELDLMHLNGEKHYYEVKTQKDHLHLACFGCGEIEEFASPTFERFKREIAAKNDFDIQVMRLEVGGLCRRCTAKQKSLQ
jgi:Fur family ferric uptake transcriptional regulator